MYLSGQEKKQFRKALIDAFPKKSSLKMMLSDELDLNMDSIVSGDSYEDLVFNLINWAEAQNKLEALLIGSLRNNPGNNELINFLEINFEKILYCDDPPIKLDLCYELISIVENIEDLGLITSCMFQALPYGVKDNNSEEIKDLENPKTNLVLKLFFISKLLIICYPYTNNCPSVLIFAEKLSREISNYQICKDLISWINKVKEVHKISLPKTSHGLTKNSRLEGYLIITVAPTNELSKFHLNAYLELPEIPIITLDLPDEQSQKGVIVSLKKTANQQAPQAIFDFIGIAEKTLTLKQKELGYKTHTLTIEFFLPLESLHEDIENFKILKLQDWITIGETYKLVVRSYDRLSDVELWNRLEECWQRIKMLLEESSNHQDIHFECWEKIKYRNSKEIAFQLKNKVGLKLSDSLPASKKLREDLFRGIVLGGIPVAIWTRCSEITGVQIMDELNCLLKLNSLGYPQSLMEGIKQKREEANCKDSPEQFLGYHLGIMYESDRWGGEIPLPEAIPLSE
ncbi:effector-associated domain EAD1-containing protein [Aetokthonos hydrillicola Thurmond2011]|jgi:hypothetical protein|uniref:Effector-associated domain EAD1-containing protein n=1 Tax=Aetokthonos hydrillicola Thurmond2011 TaxID=2712845 RepID=A0AAP5M842_9CYAN|nr:effector-associated domain EAD1-containing protein [Aetokthonos hydrillicola]MBO3459287.1 hypothetical protein [Aetokthonos hydrillicola CCALA 1050]MBW4590597.1 hypothetical protein [Aetokthonos hydrillicola CCALA 1050]MDR9894362.1 effector-associated domain EAD1-containing protein [Aetokthonos hydrillicola Thurmond2011]